MTKEELEVELGKAYRALRGLYSSIIKGKMPDETTIAYHGPTIAAAIRFCHEGSMDGSQYFIGKPFSVLLETLNYNQPKDDGRPVPHHGSGPDDQ